MSHPLHLVLGLLVLWAASLPVSAAAAASSAPALEYPSATGGYIFGRSVNEDSVVLGFAVTDTEGIAFWSGYQTLGGRSALGAALSHRYPCGDSVCQAFERALLRWEPSTEQTEPAPVLQFLHSTGTGGDMLQSLGIPAPWHWAERDAGKEWGDAVADHESLYTASDGLAALEDLLGASRHFVIGLPMAVQQTSAGMVLRGTHGAAVEGPGGTAYVIGAGGLAVAAGLVPEWALTPAEMPPSAATTPSRLVIPRTRLDAPLLPIDTAEDGSLPAPGQPEDVAWYTDSARMGEGGNMLVAAHVDWVDRLAAFHALDTLVPGDDVWVYDEMGTPTLYRVVETGRHTTRSGLLQGYMANPGRGEHSLTLVTCGGPFDVRTRTYLERFVVRAIPAGD